MKRIPWSLACVLMFTVVGQVGQFGQSGEPGAWAAEFKSKPAATVDGTTKTVTIKFAVDAATDVAVVIVNKDGKAVRHLAAGVLGENAPVPFKAGSLDQAITWDGADDAGKPVAMDGCKAKVSLGLAVKFDRFIGDDRQAFASISALAVGPKGEVYIYDGGQVVVLDRDGTYQRQIMPYPADLPIDKLAGLDPVKLDDGTKGSEGSVFLRRGYPVGKWTNSAIGSMGISPDGKMLYLPGPPRYARRLTRIGTDGSVPAGAFDTRLTSHADNGYLFLACSPDGRTLYFAGAQAGYMGDDARELSYRPSVYRLKLDTAGPAETFTGDDENWGKDGFSVDTPKGLATDPAGHLYVCNYGHDDSKTTAEETSGYVAVYTPGAGFVKSFKIQHPQQVAVNPKTGQLYVLCGADFARFAQGYHWPEVLRDAKVVQLSADGKVEKEIVLDPPYLRSRKDAKTGLPATRPEFNLRMAADFSDPAKPIVWVGVSDPSASFAKFGLLRIEDSGGKFGEPKDVCSHDKGSVRGQMSRMAVDRDHDILYLSSEGNNFKRYNAIDGTLLDPIRLKDENGKDAKLTICESYVGPEGMIYFLAATEGYSKGGLFRAGPDGKMSPFSAEQPKVTHMLKSAAGSSSRGFTASPRTGETYVLYYDDARPADKQPPEAWEKCLPIPIALAKFAPDGACINKHLVCYLRSGANGVRVDSRGNVYVADNFMPAGVAYPPDIAKVMPEDPLKRPYPARLADASFDPLLRWMGCVVKFGPEGGKIVGLPEDPGGPGSQPVGGRSSKLLATDLYRPVPQTQWFMFNYHSLKITGAQWQFHGIAPIPAQYQGVTHVERCVCNGARFDIDGFDRVFIPDSFRNRVTVLDSAGNVICRFGQYGNRDSTGLSLSAPGHVAAGNDYAFVGDSGSRRLVKGKFTYAAEAETPLGG